MRLETKDRNVEIMGQHNNSHGGWQAEILHRLAKEFKEAEHELHQFSLEGEVA